VGPKINFTKGVAKASLAGIGNDNILIRMLWTGIFMITQLIRLPAGEHLLYCPDNIFTKRILMFR